jgi:hypothetical protein
MRFPEWYTVELSSTSRLDGDFCKKFTEQVIKIYNVELSNTVNFSIFPKKVSRDQPKVMLLFKKPIEAGDKVRLELTRGRQTETLAEVMTTNPYAAMIRVPGEIFHSETVFHIPSRDCNPDFRPILESRDSHLEARFYEFPGKINGIFKKNDFSILFF